MGSIVWVPPSSLTCLRGAACGSCLSGLLLRWMSVLDCPLHHLLMTSRSSVQCGLLFEENVLQRLNPKFRKCSWCSLDAISSGIRYSFEPENARTFESENAVHVLDFASTAPSASGCQVSFATRSSYTQSTCHRGYIILHGLCVTCNRRGIS